MFLFIGPYGSKFLGPGGFFFGCALRFIACHSSGAKFLRDCRLDDFSIVLGLTKVAVDSFLASLGLEVHSFCRFKVIGVSVSQI